MYYRFNHRFHHPTPSGQATSKPDDIRLFDSAFCLSLEGASALKEGRGTAALFPFNGGTLLLKQYLRGGLIQHLSASAYVWTGLARTRAWREFDLLQHMQQLELPVPQVFACRVEKSGLNYAAHLIVEAIANVGSLQQILNRQAGAQLDWQEIGRVVGGFSNERIYHADLNLSNILLGADGCYYLIDFDRGSRLPAWVFRHYYERRMLKRLSRSLEKAGLHTATPENAQSKLVWDDFTAGYKSIRRL